MTSSTCRFCSAPLHCTVVDLGMSPLANAYIKPSQLRQMEPFYPLQVFVCDQCFLVQLEEFESPENIFSDYAYFSSYSTSWLQHAADYCVEVAERFGLNGESRVVELASNDGYLLRNFVDAGIPVLGIEPAANVAEVAVKRGIPTLVRFFGAALGRELAEDGLQADLIVANNVLAHVPNLNDFVAGMKQLLKPGGAITVEFPHLQRLMEERQFDTIYHEHFSYFSFIAVERVFAHHGLTMFDVEELPTHGGSLRIYARHSENGALPVDPRVAELRAREQAMGFDSLARYTNFAAEVQQIKQDLLAFLIQARREGRTVVGYGAPAKGNTLLNYCGVGRDFIEYTVDRNPHKQGHYLPGTHIPIRGPEAIAETQPDYVLILPWNLKQEIMRSEGYIAAWGGQFVIPIPHVHVEPAVQPALAPLASVGVTGWGARDSAEQAA
jgi:SAM-dependent methyltransferase